MSKKIFSLDGVANIVIALAICCLAAAIALPALKAPLWVIAWLRGIGITGLLVFVILWAWIQRADLVRFFKHRRTRSGANSLVQVLAFIGILVLVNVIAFKHHARWDFTANREYSLSAQTDKILKSLKSDVKVTYFYQANNPSWQKARELWKEYTYRSGRVKLVPIDIDQDPVSAQQYGVSRYGTSVVETNGRKIQIDGNTEQDYTGALIKATRPNQKTAFFLVGHGESEPSGFGEESLSQARTALEKQNYKIETLNLMSQKDIPASASVLVVAGPKKPLMESEKLALDRYIARGGKLYVFLNPQIRSGIENWLRGYGLIARDDVVIDIERYAYPNISAPLANGYPYHTITQKLPASFFPHSRSLVLLDKMPSGISASPLVETSNNSWGETNLLSRKPEYNQGQDYKGPIQLGYALTLDKSKSRMVVFGNARFETDRFFNEVGNGDLFLAAFNWLAEDEDLISIPPKPPGNQPVMLSNKQVWGIFYGVLSLPLVLMLFGGFVWWRRRRL